MAKTLNSRIPEGPVSEKWTNYKAHQRLVNPKNKLKLDVIVVGTGLAGASAAASLGEMGFNVINLCIQDSPRRAHSIAAQGGINAAKNYQNDGDSVYRLFYDTVKGGDYRAREANVYRLAEVSNNIIDQCVAQGVPFAREYGGMLANRSFGGAQVSRTFYAKGQTGQQLLLGAYSSLSRMVNAGKVKLYTRYEMEDVVIVNGRARGIIAKNLVTGKLERFSANAVVIATGGYGNTYFLSTNAMGCNCTAAIQCYRKGAMMANPSYVQIHPTCIPVHGDNQSKLTLMSESLRNDGRIWVPKNLDDAKALQAGTKQGWEIKEADRDYYLERRYPAFGNLVPRDVASRAAKERCDKGFGVNNTGLAVFLDFSESIQRLGIDEIRQRYGNLFDMYEEITDVNPGEFVQEVDGIQYYKPMMIFPAIHYTMGGIWVDYELQTTIPGLFAIGECNFSDHGANRLGASALMDTSFSRTPSRTISPTRRYGHASQPTCLSSMQQRKPLTQRWTASSTSKASALSIPSTRNSDTSCGSTSAWDAPRKVSKKASSCSSRYARSSTPTSSCPEQKTVSTSNSTKPYTSATSSSWASSSLTTHSTARNRAADTSAKSTRQKKARQNATTRTSSTSALGSISRTTKPLRFSAKNLLSMR